MAKSKSPENFSVEELRRLMVEKRRSSRQGRLEHFRKTGRIVSLAEDLEMDSLESMHSSLLSDMDSNDKTKGKRKSRKVLDGFLLVVEIFAVLGLVFVLFNGLDVIRQLNQ